MYRCRYYLFVKRRKNKCHYNKTLITRNWSSWWGPVTHFDFWFNKMNLETQLMKSGLDKNDGALNFIFCCSSFRSLTLSDETAPAVSGLSSFPTCFMLLPLGGGHLRMFGSEPYLWVLGHCCCSKPQTRPAERKTMWPNDFRAELKDVLQTWHSWISLLLSQRCGNVQKSQK